jgi:hypothetical protein
VNICPHKVTEEIVDKKKVTIPNGHVEQLILLIREQKVILDANLAGLYGVETRRLNEQVKRNADGFSGRFHVSAVT